MIEHFAFTADTELVSEEKNRQVIGKEIVRRLADESPSELSSSSVVDAVEIINDALPSAQAEIRRDPGL